MSLPRREFLGLAGVTGLLAATGAPLHATQPDAIVPIAADWDMTWVDRISGRHRAVFDSPGVSDGAALFRAVMWMDQYKEVYGTARTDMSPVVVLRHSGTKLALNDEFWTKFDIAKEIAAEENPAPQPSASAPSAAAPPAAASSAAASAQGPATPSAPATSSPAPAPRGNPLSGTGMYSLSTFQAAGGIVLVCNIAFQQSAGRFRRADRSLTREASIELARTHLMPGVILQPSGIFAALRAQEAGCHYIIAG